MRSSLRFLALSVAIAMCGCAGIKTPPPPPPPPPPPRDHPNAVSLQVQGGAAYSCTFSGGDDAHGKVIVARAEGDVNIHLNLTSANFVIYSLSFKDDNGQLRYRLENHDTNAVIHDDNSGNMDAYYGVLVADLGTNPDPNQATKFLCDPRIVNN